MSEGIRTPKHSLEGCYVAIDITLTWWAPGESNTVLLFFRQALAPTQLGTQIASDLYPGFCLGPSSIYAAYPPIIALRPR